MKRHITCAYPHTGKLSDDKGMKFWPKLQPGEPWRHHARWKKSVTKDHVLYGSVYRTCPEGRLVVSYGGGMKWTESDWQWTHFFLEWQKYSKIWWQQILEIALKSTDLYI